MKQPKVNHGFKEEAKSWMTMPKLDEIKTKIGVTLNIHNVNECKDFFLHCNILYSQLSFTTKMKKETLNFTTVQ
jgi:hypothetical protein